MATLTDAQAQASARLTSAYKTQQNRDAAKIAALIAVYYRTRVDVEDPKAVEAWLDLMIPRLIRSSDTGARDASAFFRALRAIEVPGAPKFTPSPSLGAIDEGVRKSLLAVGPFDYMNKAADIRRLDVSPVQQQALLREAKDVTSTKVAAAVVRHAQAGSRQTIHDNSAEDKVALGWVRVTRAKPCAFCAMLASRGITYRAFKEHSFEMSDSRFTGEGNAKVHDECGCALKPVYSKSDPVLKQNQGFADMWSMWGAGGGDAAARFRRGYEHWRETGQYLSWDAADSA